MKTILLLSFTVILTVFLSCSPTRDIPNSGCGESVIVSQTTYNEAPSDELSILEAEIKGDCLKISTQTGGGCEEHEYMLIDAGAVMYSLPPQRTLRVSLDKKGDLCKALLYKDLKFDLTALQMEGESAVVLRLEGFEERLTYEY